MLRRMILLALVSAACLGPWAAVEAGVDHRAPVERRTVAVDGRLRSAFLLRARGIDKLEPVANAREKQLRLRRHFDAVLDLLVQNTEKSLDIAVARLEARRGERWADEERELWRQELAEARLVNIYRLYRYQQRGRFPINEHATDRAVPVFVDNYDTACAVGHLMRESGWGNAVAAIQAENNLVYVTDVKDGPVAAWVADSGLTQEEAAIIQPAYEPPPFTASFQDMLFTPDRPIFSEFSANGLRYKDFTFYRGADKPTGQANFLDYFFNGMPDISMSYLSAQSQPYATCCAGIAPPFKDWLFLGQQSYNLQPLGQVSGGQELWVRYSYKVIAEAPGSRISAASLMSQPNFIYSIMHQGTIDATTSIRSLTDFASLGELDGHGDANVGSGWLYGNDQISFAPQAGIQVDTLVHLSGAGVFSGLVHSFQVIPEPSGTVAWLALGALVAFHGVRPRLPQIS